MQKTSKLFPLEKAKQKRSEIIDVLRMNSDPGFCQLNDNNDGRGFLTIRTADNALKGEIEKILAK